MSKRTQRERATNFRVRKSRANIVIGIIAFAVIYLIIGLTGSVSVALGWAGAEAFTIGWGAFGAAYAYTDRKGKYSTYFILAGIGGILVLLLSIVVPFSLIMVNFGLSTLFAANVAVWIWVLITFALVLSSFYYVNKDQIR